jgi:hypothetical protein
MAKDKTGYIYSKTHQEWKTGALRIKVNSSMT